jgi:hypothetical protein
VSAEPHNPKPRGHSTGKPNYLPPVYPGHLGVHQQQIEFAASSAQETDPLESITRLQYVASVALESVRYGGPAARVVVDYENGGTGG